MHIMTEKISQIGRRAFIQQGSLILAASASLSGMSCSERQNVPLSETSQSASPPSPPPKPVRFGLITDLHYADKPPKGTRFYQETLSKLEESSQNFADRQIDLVVELGDLIDAADSVETELGYLKTINKAFSGISRDRHYVLGNHCVDMLTKNEFLGEVEQPSAFYSFNRGEIHFVVLDACFRSDGASYGRKNSTWTDSNIPPEQLDWLQADLKESRRKTIVLTHQRLDTTTNHSVRNSDQVRKVLEDSGIVLAVFQGHSHENDLTDIGNIHYCTLRAMVEGSGAENNGFSVVEISADGTIQVSGFRQQSDYNWSPKV